MPALALLTFWLERTVHEDARRAAAAPARPGLSSWSNFTTTTLQRATAPPSSMLSAAKMVHYPDDDSTELFAPRVLHAKPDEPR